MPKHSHREKILTEGLKVVHAHGFANASVRDIVRAAGVPQGSFTNHFESKEAFGLEVIELYRSRNAETIQQTLRNDALPPLQRLRAYIDAAKDRLNRDQMRNGCLYGNFTAEASDHSERIRQRLLEVFGEVRLALAYCLRAAVKAGELSPGLDCDEVAAFIVSSMQGANLLSKAERSTVPVERFKEILFTMVLRRTGSAEPLADCG
ncbi:Transcriptional regulator AcuR [Variovorax sp. SRS16]|uniref:TetR/AcrR family transcriptional regulator n=1 Tax=Variovorax sp. SRS16 TaxID=282217 RepID=UPI0013170F1A|nr:TetR/AcrR family transcriptional regulator [Variovorax sp. SRS16]VTU33095.1 Transcriptional regulator AcuR [Variovorax sp. SRS16]